MRVRETNLAHYRSWLIYYKSYFLAVVTFSIWKQWYCLIFHNESGKGSAGLGEAGARRTDRAGAGAKGSEE